MKNDSRYCPVCHKQLFKQDHRGFVLIIRCDQCNNLVHERCYLNHQILHHNLIAIKYIDLEEEEGVDTYTLE